MAVVDEWHHKDDKDDEYGWDDKRGDDWDDSRHGDKRRSGRLVLVRNHEPALGTPYVNNPKITYLNDASTTKPRRAQSISCTSVFVSFVSSW